MPFPIADRLTKWSALPSKTRIRLRIALISLGDQLVCTAIYAGYVAIGTIDWVPLMLMMSIGVLTHCFVFAAIASGWSQRLADPSLTKLQVGLGFVLTLLATWLLPEIGYWFVFGSVVIACFASLNLSRRQFVVSWFLLSLGFVVVLALNDFRIRLPLETDIERLLFAVALVLNLGRVFLITSEVSRLRATLAGKNKQLEAFGRRLELSRNYLQLVLNALPVGVYVFDKDGRAALYNEFAVNDMPFMFAAGAPDLHTVQRHFKTVDVRLEDVSAVTSTEGFGPDRRNYIVSARALPKTDSEQNGSSLILTFLDVSELRAAEAKRESALNFLGHDLRAPLASLIALVDTPTPTSGLGSAERQHIQRLAERCLSLADDFVLMTRAEAIREEHFLSVSLTEIVFDAIDSVSPRAALRRVSITVPDEPPVALVNGDWSLLLRAMINMLNNAVKFSPQDDTVAVGVMQEDRFWMVVIEDRGCGFDAVFLSSRRAGQHHFGAGHDSVGLGLALVHQVAAQHGGALRLANRSPHGARVELLLPINQAN